MGSTRKETERTKYVQEKCQTLLTSMLRDEDNKYCVDCDAKGPRWASWNLGIFLCIRCAGIHRNLGVHISRVRSVNLDTWTPEQVLSLQQMGNSRARAVYEAQLPDGFRRPQTDSALECFIRAKYEHKKYMAREWVQPPPPKADWDREIDEEMEKQKRKKKATTSGGISVVEKKSTVAKTTATIPAPLPKPKSVSGSPKSNRSLNTLDTSGSSSGSSDLLGLASPPPTTTTSSGHNTTHDLSTDVFSNFLSATPDQSDVSNIDVAQPVVVAATTNLNREEQDFFNQMTSEKDKAKMTKDSIMALYGTGPTSNGGFTGQFHTSMGQTGFNSVQPVFMNQQMMVNGRNFINGPTSLPNNNNFNAFNSNSVPVMTTGGGQPFQQSSFASFPTVVPNGTGVGPFGQSTAAPSTINHQFANLNLGNVWQ